MASGKDDIFHPVVTAGLMAALIMLLLAGCRSESDPTTPSASSADGPPDSVRTAVVSAVEAIDGMRSQLATTFDPDHVTKETFQRVCKPVGKRAKTVARDSGWVVQQLAEKYRNPAHQLDSVAAQVYDHFEANPGQTALWRRATLEGTEGWRYFHRITVEPSCLACHGPKDNRPAFIRAGYPDDRAYGFSPGDLRGLYAVFVPDVGLTDEPASPPGP